uniref:2-oxoisovalerate dehydrogenase subunit alpha n=1 Tax=uncultured Chloroflexota bacterium TaxID=166587 RepID=H5SN51_9CHLR|nr:2-oxoisovalerate dehydrogenase E1 component, alpha subunit [uncultured Chloroflexota bacterium]
MTEFTLDQLRTFYYKMVLTRTLGQRLRLLRHQGRINIVALADGHEAAQVGSASALRVGVDFVYTYYRDMGVALTLGMRPHDFMAQAFARATDPNSRGRLLPGDLNYPPARLMAGGGPIATQLPQAAGTALASQIKGEDAVTIVYFGEGASSEGEFHESCNFAGIHRLPLIFFCENNQYALSVPLNKEVAGEGVACKAAGYGFPGVVVDGSDVLAVYQATCEARERARQGQGPTLIEARLYRLAAHSTDDDDSRYRSPEEVESQRQNDPLLRFKRYLLAEKLLTASELQALETRAADEVEAAQQFAEDSPYPDPAELWAHVYGD